MNSRRNDPPNAMATALHETVKCLILHGKRREAQAVQSCIAMLQGGADPVIGRYINAKVFDADTQEALMQAAFDVISPIEMTLQIDHPRKVVYISVNGIQILRVCRIQNIRLDITPK